MSAATVLTPPVRTPLEDLSTRDLESELLGLAGHIAAAECRFLRLLAEFDQRNGWAGDGIRSCAHWLSWRAGMSRRTAIEHLRVAHALKNLPRIGEAFAAGRISYSKVRAITRITGTDDATEQKLLNVAQSGTASHIETIVRAVRRRNTPPADPVARRSLSWHWNEDGSLVVRGRFTPDEGAAFIAAVDALVPPRTPIRHPVPAPPDDLDERALEQEPGPAVDRAAARRADALLALVNGGTGGDAGGSAVDRGRTQVIVHVNADSGTARLDNGPEIAASTAERLACDARVQLLLQDRTTNRLYLGRSRRLATPAQIAALTVRDGAGCRFPGCGHTRHLHAHHVRHWLRGGRTDIDNLILICGYHHRLIHDHGYRIRRLPGRWEILRPDGTPIPADGVALTGNVESLIEVNTRARLRIDRTTLTPDWDGERLDSAPILDALLPRLRRKAGAGPARAVSGVRPRFRSSGRTRRGQAVH